MTIDRILLVRLGALGDIIHALPVAAALRHAFPGARIDWLVSARHREILDHVPVIDRRVLLDSRSRGIRKSHDDTVRPPGPEDVGPPISRPVATGPVTVFSGVARAIAELREADYDIAFDLQGLLKSAILARSSGARRVIGFPVGHLRERWAHLFYTETVEPPTGVHVVDKNLALLAAVGLHNLPREFPIIGTGGLASDAARSGQVAGFDSRFAVLNPGAGWPNKRWPPDRFGTIAVHLRAAHALPSLVLWGPGEEDLARVVVEASGGAARLAPPTGIGDMISLARAAALFVSGDTGPLHIAAAVGAPIVGIYGPTSPGRNGPWDPADVCVSRFDACQCHHRRRCRLPVCCVLDIGLDEVRAAIDHRLAVARTAPGTRDEGPGTLA